MLEAATWASLAAGATDGGHILQTCRYAAFGRETYGRDAVHAALRERSLDWASPPLIAGGQGFSLLIGETEQGALALAADHYDGWVGRLWRVGPGEPAPCDFRGLAVPADTDLSQCGGAWRFRADDHPDLLASDGAELLEAMSTWIEAAPREWRRLRPMVLRAASTAEGVAVLLRVDAEIGQEPQPIAIDVAMLIPASGAVLAARSVPLLLFGRTAPRL